MDSSRISPISAPGRLMPVVTSNFYQHKSYLPLSDETSESRTSLQSALVLKFFRQLQVVFDKEMAVKEVMKLLNIERKFITCKKLGPDEHLVWLENQEQCDIVMATHRVFFVNGVKCQFHVWNASSDADMNKVSNRVWLEFYNIPSHYFLTDIAWCLVSGIGDIVDIDVEAWKTDVSCMAICVDTDKVPQTITCIDLHYDHCFLVEANCRVVFAIPLEDYRFFECHMEGKNYSGILQEVKFRYSQKLDASLFEEKFRKEFRDYIDWKARHSQVAVTQGVNSSPIEFPASSYSTPVRATKSRRLEDEFGNSFHGALKGEDSSVFSCFLTASEETLMQQSDYLRSVVIKVDSAGGSSFKIEDLIAQVVVMYGGTIANYQWKHYVEGQFLLWLSTKAERDDLVSRCEWLIIKGIKVFMKPWAVNLNATYAAPKFRVWLELTALPIHYFHNKHIVAITSSLGFVVDVDYSRMNYDCSGISVCIETVNLDQYPRFDSVVYDGIYLKAFTVKKLFELPCSIYKIVNAVVKSRNYNGKMIEYRNFVSNKKFEELMNGRTQGEFSSYIKWNERNNTEDPSDYWSSILHSN